MLHKLQNIGFIEVGKWQMENDYFTHTIVEYLNEKKILYSFVSENNVLYIGKTTNFLKSRMNGYKNPHSTQKTNYRVKAKIIDLLSSGKEVCIFILIDKTVFNFGGYTLCLASGLEDTLIADLNPKWNDRGVLKI